MEAFDEVPCKCLVCFAKVEPESDDELESESHQDDLQLIQPPNKCSKLIEKQLGIIFILRNVLDLPSIQLERFLEVYGNPEHWVKVCSSCVGLINYSKRAFSELQKVYRKYEEVKGVIHEKIQGTAHVAQLCGEEIGRFGVTSKLKSPKSPSKSFLVWDRYASRLSQRELGQPPPEPPESIADQTEMHVEPNLSFILGLTDEDYGDGDSHHEVTMANNDDVDVEPSIVSDSNSLSQESKEMGRRRKKTIDLATAPPKHVNGFTCGVCFKVFKTTSAKSLHQRRHFPGQEQCPHCSKTFVRISEVQRHVERVHGIVVEATEPKRRGAGGGRGRGRRPGKPRKVKQKSATRARVGSPTIPELDDVNDSDSNHYHVNRESPIQENADALEPPAPITYVTKVTPKTENVESGSAADPDLVMSSNALDPATLPDPIIPPKLLETFTAVHPEIPSSHLRLKEMGRRRKKIYHLASTPAKHVNAYTCGICFKRFTTTSAKSIHQQRHFPGKFRCSFCPKVFIRRSEVERHMTKVHKGGTVVTYVDTEDKYPCPLCGKVFRKKKTLRSHEAYAHADRTAFACSHCEYKGYSRAVLDYHLAKEHGIGVEHYTCETCFIFFKTKTQKQRHICGAPEPEVIPIPQVCQYCGREFDSNKKLKIHEATIHEKRWRYNCDLCDFHTQCKDHYIRHQAVKHKIGAFSCEFPGCSRTYHRKTFLDEHVKYEHLGVERPKEHVCMFCGKQFPRLGNLTSHIQINHSTKTPYTCGICGESFKTGSYLSKHRSRKHKNLKEAIS